MIEMPKIERMESRFSFDAAKFEADRQNAAEKVAKVIKAMRDDGQELPEIKKAIDRNSHRRKKHDGSDY